MRLLLICCAAFAALTGCSTLSPASDQKDGGDTALCEAATYVVYFDDGVSTFDAGASKTLDNIRSEYMLCDLYHIELQGHADSVGDAESNMALSTARAEAVRDALSVRGLSASRVSIIPMGEGETKIDGDPDAFERKVVIRVLPE